MSLVSNLSFSPWGTLLALAIVVVSWLFSRFTRRATASLLKRVNGV